MVQPQKFGYLHLVYHFTVPLKSADISKLHHDVMINFCYS